MSLANLGGCGFFGGKKPPTPAYPPSRVPGAKPYCVLGKCYFPLASAEGFVEEGLASWYGPNFHGKRTSSGEVFDMYSMTAAHKTLPLGTYVRVTRLDNYHSIVVRINDRGPFVSNRVIDLSRKAAEELGMLSQGTVPVRIEALQPATLARYNNQYMWVPQPMPSLWKGRFEIQVAAFENKDNAYRFERNISRRYQNTAIVPYYFSGRLFYRVRVGYFDDLHKARSALESIRREFPDAFVVAQEEQRR